MYQRLQLVFSRVFCRCRMTDHRSNEDYCRTVSNMWRCQCPCTQHEGIVSIWRYSATHSYAWRYKDNSGQPRIQAALLKGKMSPISTHQETGWVPDPVQAFWIKIKFPWCCLDSKPTTLNLVSILTKQSMLLA